MPPRTLALGAVVVVAAGALVAGANPAAARPRRPEAVASALGRRARALRNEVPDIDANHVVARFAARPFDLSGRLARAGARIERVIPGTRWTELATAPGNAVRVRDRLRRDPAVVQVELSYIRHASAVPNDPQWSVQAAYLAPLRVDRAYDRSQGSGVTVAVVDTGVDLDHPDLAGRLVAGYNVLAPGASPQDDFGHGTMVAGIIAADANNGRGVAGIAPLARVMPVKVLDAGGGGNDPDIATGIHWAVDHHARVINLSLGGPASSSVLSDAVNYARAHDVVVVAAAGNDGAETVEYPAALPGVLAVSATTHNGALAAFSSYGWRIDVAAPGFDIRSTALGSGDQYTTASGTSFSSPIVAGTAALVRAQNPSWTATTVDNRIRTTARDVGPPGVDAAFGYGIVDPLAALGGAPAAPHPARRDGGDEPNDTPANATPLAISVTHTAKIQPELDNDWYDVNFTSTGWYTIDVPAGVPAFDHTMDPIIELYDAQLALNASSDLRGGVLTVHISNTGHRFIRVRNRGGDTAPYTITVFATATPARFSSPLELDFNTTADATAIADVNGDGRNDVLFTFGKSSGFANTLVALYQTPERSFVYGASVSTDKGNGTGLVTGDLDGDLSHVPEAALPVDGGVDIFGQTGNGLDVVQTLTTPATPSQLSITDVDGDGHNDLVVAGSFGVRVYHGPALSTFTTITGTSATALAVGDVNDDGRPDVVTCCVKVYTQNANHTFAGATNHAIAGSVNVAVGDVSGDGKDDIVTTVRGSTNAVAALVQNGSGFATVTKTIAARPSPIAIADVDGDGKNDVVVVHNFAGDPSVDLPTSFGWLHNLGSPSFANEQQFSIDDFGTNYDEHALAAGDVDRDGATDVVVATTYGVAILTQNTPQLPALEAAWVRAVQPLPLSTDVAATVQPVVTLGRTPDVVDGTTVQLLSAAGATVPATIAFNGASKQVTIQPSSPLANGRYVIRMALSDATREQFNYGSSFVVGPAPDETAPQTLLHAPPSGFLTSATATMSFTASEAATFECSLDNKPYRACASGLHENVAPGRHVFNVFARDVAGNEDASPARATWTYRPVPHGYWMLGSDGAVYPFGTVSGLGRASTFGAADIEVTPSGFGYWIVDVFGRVYAYGDAAWRGNAGVLLAGERVTGISRTATGRGYWLFTSRGRVFPFGDAKFYGDMSRVALNGPVLDSVSTPSGKGYYMVASDGGVFSFGDARFHGSTGGLHIAAPVRTLVPDPDGSGYWLVGVDGAVYAFDAPFRGSMSGTRLNRPVVGMVAFGNGYLMVASDGGIFNFSSKPFFGSLAGRPPRNPIVSVAAFG